MPNEGAETVLLSISREFGRVMTTTKHQPPIIEILGIHLTTYIHQTQLFYSLVPGEKKKHVNI
jgi:hypothetical protein